MNRQEERADSPLRHHQNIRRCHKFAPFSSEFLRISAGWTVGVSSSWFCGLLLFGQHSVPSRFGYPASPRSAARYRHVGGSVDECACPPSSAILLRWTWGGAQTSVVFVRFCLNSAADRGARAKPSPWSGQCSSGLAAPQTYLGHLLNIQIPGYSLKNPTP